MGKIYIHTVHRLQCSLVVVRENCRAARTISRMDVCTRRYYYYHCDQRCFTGTFSTKRAMHELESHATFYIHQKVLKHPNVASVYIKALEHMYSVTHTSPSSEDLIIINSYRRTRMHTNTHTHTQRHVEMCAHDTALLHACARCVRMWNRSSGDSPALSHHAPQMCGGLFSCARNCI